MNPAETIAAAHLQFIYNLKLYEYAVRKHIDEGLFDSEIEMEGEKGFVKLRAGLLGKDGVINGASNNVMISLGTLFITIESCLSDLGIKKNTKDFSELGMYRNLIYLLRCAFAHNMLDPKWEIKPPFSDINFNIDLGHSKILGKLGPLNGTSFDQKHIGGYRNILDLVKLGTILIKKIHSGEWEPKSPQ